MRDNTGIPNTYPSIDECISAASTAIDEMDSVIAQIGDEPVNLSDYVDGLRDAIVELEGCFKNPNCVIEGVRTANSNLRDAANEALNERDEKQDEIQELENRISQLESEIEGLKTELEEANESISNHA